MTNKIIKILTLIAIVILCMFSIMNCSYGFSVSNITGSNLTGSARTSIDNFGQNVINIIATVGSIISVVMLVILGIKYMMGSTEEKAEYKKSLLPYFIGAVILFGASTIAGIIYNIAINL